MAVSAQKGAFGWVGQFGQDDFLAAAEYDSNGMTWHKVLAGELGLVDNHRPYDPEVGGSLLPAGTYKSAYWSGGRLVMHPRLAFSAAPANGMVPLFWTYAGSVASLPAGTVVSSSTLPDAVTGGTGVTLDALLDVDGGDDVLLFPGGDGAGIQFGYDQGDGDDKWLTVRRLIPSGAGGYVGETFYNSKVGGLTFNAVPSAPLRLEAMFMGGAGDSDALDQAVLEAFAGLPTAGEGWDFGSAASVDTVPYATQGFLKEGAATAAEVKRARSLTIALGAGMTTPEDMLVIGQQAPFDYSILGRGVNITYDFLWENADLYRQIQMGGASATTWSSTAYKAPFWTKFTDQSGDYKIGFFAQSVSWMAAPVRLAPQQQVVMQVTGIVNDVAGARWSLWLAAAGLSGAAGWPTAT